MRYKNNKSLNKQILIYSLLNWREMFLSKKKRGVKGRQRFFSTCGIDTECWYRFEWSVLESINSNVEEKISNQIGGVPGCQKLPRIGK